MYDAELLVTGIDKVTLPTGKVIPLDYVEMAADRVRFYYGGFEVTDYLSREQKKTFPGFNVVADNIRMSDTYGAGPTDIGSTSVIGLTFDGIWNDVKDTSQATREFITGQPGEMSSLKKWLIAGVVLVGLYYVVQLVKAFKA